jgi:hypothetical protein
MPAKSGASHALAAFLSIVLGSILSNFISSHSGLLTTASESVGGTITGTTGITLSENAVGLLTISTALAFLWGVAYHRARHQSETEAGRRKNYVTDNHSSNKPQQMPTPDAQNDEISSSVNAKRGYQAVEESRTAEETLSAVQRDLEDVQIVLTELHDRLADAEERETAERVSTLREEVIELKTTVDSATRQGSPQERDGRGTAVSDGSLVAVHARMLDTGNELVDIIESIHDAKDVDDSFFEECRLLIRDLDRTVSKQQDILDQQGTKP